jgi:hypothetical protein
MEGLLWSWFGDDLQQARNVQVLLWDDGPPYDAIGSIRTDHHIGMVLTLTGCDHHPGPGDSNALHDDIFLNEEAAFTRFGGQPGVELMPADGAESKLAIFIAAHHHTPASEVKVCPVHIHVRNFGDIQAQLTQYHFGIR